MASRENFRRTLNKNIKKTLILVATLLLLLIPTNKAIAQPNGVPITQEMTMVEQSPKDMIAQAFPDAPIMVKIAGAESHVCDPDWKVNKQGSSARGCFQILKSTWQDYNCKGDVMNNKDNIECARKIYDDRGIQPWNASRQNWA